MNFTPGCLVHLRDRDWIVQPSDDPELLLLKPLGGSDDETAGVYLPLELPADLPKPSQFPLPTSKDIGNLHTARLLHDAARLAFRNGAGPFRSLAKLSFRPRAYQMVPLVMALRQDIVRLLIADDVGVGKTVEALLILRELLERRVIRRFAVICRPHLCDQWQDEIRRKLDMEAVVIRSSTQARLDREIQGDISVFDYYPCQVISIDYIKSETRRDTFIQQCPELVIVDEVHSCAKPDGATQSQQQRHDLIARIAAKPNQHLIMLTATPHSGKPAEFQSLLGLLNPDFAALDLVAATENQRRQIARHFIQRRRADVQQWASESTTFAIRDPKDFCYDLTPAYAELFDQIIDFARTLVSDQATGRRRRISYWTALALLRGVASSPAAGAAMLRARLDRIAQDESFGEDERQSPVHDSDPGRETGFESDNNPVELMAEIPWSESQQKRLRELATRLEALSTPAKDAKLAAAGKIIEDNLRDGASTVIFCRYIASAHYLGERLPAILKKSFPKTRIEVVTSEDPDELRRERIDAMADSPQRILIATDCLSEGINLQNLFTSVLHYDLPWNPNRLEQREGRVDRFGQTAPVVRTALLYGKNPVDGIVLDIILNKIREIRKGTGINIAFPEDSRSIIDSIAQAVLFSPSRKRLTDGGNQLELDLTGFDEEQEIKLRVSQKIEEAERREKVSRTIFAQHAIKADELEKDLREADEFIGNPDAVHNFVEHALGLLGVELTKSKHGYKLQTHNLPAHLKALLPARPAVPVSFESPTPEDHYYLGRNHPFVEQLCHLVMRNTLAHDHRQGASRSAIIRSAHVKEKHTIFLCRCRNVIARPGDPNKIVAEEMLLWGYRGFHKDNHLLFHDDAKRILYEARATANLSPEAGASTLENEVANVWPNLQPCSDQIATDRAEQLVAAHHRFSTVVKDAATRFKVVTPVLPMDILGIYIILSEVAP